MNMQILMVAGCPMGDSPTALFREGDICLNKFLILTYLFLTLTPHNFAALPCGLTQQQKPNKGTIRHWPYPDIGTHNLSTIAIKYGTFWKRVISRETVTVWWRHVYHRLGSGNVVGNTLQQGQHFSSGHKGELAWQVRSLQIHQVFRTELASS